MNPIKKMKQQSSENYYSFINFCLCIVLSAVINMCTAQTNTKRQFTFCNEKSDTIHIADLTSCAELIAADPQLKIKSYVISIRVAQDFVDFDPNEGSTLNPDILNEILKEKKNLIYIKIKDIIAKNGKVEKKFDGYKLYVK